MSRAHPLAVALVAAALALPPPARACSVCGCDQPILDPGDPAALTSRLSVALEAEALRVEAASETVEGARDRLEQEILRLRVVGRLAEGLSLAGVLPVTHKRMSVEGTTTSDVTGLGDAEVGLRWTALQRVDLGAGRAWSLGLSGGTSLPTGPNDLQADGARIDEHGQPGTGSWGPFAGVHLRFGAGIWDLSANLSGRAHTVNGAGYRYGAALLWSVHAQARPAPGLALDLAVDARHAAADGDPEGTVPDTGGAVLALAPGISWNVAGPTWLTLRAQLPVATALRGDQWVGPAVVAGVQVELF